MKDIFRNYKLLTKAFCAIPDIVLVVDDELRIFFLNSAARGLTGAGAVYGEKVGDVVHCVNSGEAPGCGASESCSKCIIRASVDAAVKGSAVYKKRYVFRYMEGGVKSLPLLLTCAPFGFKHRRLCVVVLEDVSDLVKLHSLLPICFGCKKIRNDANYWENVEQYITEHFADVQFSHGLCPKCAKRLYPDLAAGIYDK